MRKRRNRVFYRSSRAIFGCVAGLVLVIISFIVLRINIILWLILCSLGIRILGINLPGVFGKKYDVEIEEESDEVSSASNSSMEERLKQLEDLREKRLITAGEYEEKRKEILKEL